MPDDKDSACEMHLEGSRSSAGCSSGGPQRVSDFAFRSFSMSRGDLRCHRASPATPSLSASLPKVPSAVFDIELEEDSSMIGTAVQSETAAAVAKLEDLLTPRSCEEAKLLETVKELCMAPEVQSDWRLLAHQLQCCGYGVRIRKAVGGGEGGDCLKNLRHSFLHCSIPGASRMFIVDPTFRDQFSIMHPTDHYSAVLAEVPSPVVLPEDRVAPVVHLLSKEISQVFKQHGIVLPPWRKTSSVLTKWLPRQSLDQSVADAGEPQQADFFPPMRQNSAFEEHWTACYQGRDSASAEEPLEPYLHSWDTPARF